MIVYKTITFYHMMLSLQIQEYTLMSTDSHSYKIGSVDKATFCREKVELEGVGKKEERM